MSNAQKKPFDLTTHVRDGKGNIIKSQPYRLVIQGNTEEFERPPGSGYWYTRGNELIRKPSPEVQKAQAAKEFSNDQLLKQIEELKSQLSSNQSFLALEEEVEIPEVPVGETDNSEEIALMEAAGAKEDAKALQAVKAPQAPVAPKFVRQNFTK